jgi:hypothetical protein
MATLESQYRSYLVENPGSSYSFEEWQENVLKPILNNASMNIKEDTESVVTYLIRELVENRLLALRYDKDNTLNEIVNRAKAMEEQKMLQLVNYSQVMTTAAAPVEYVVREFKKDRALKGRLHKSDNGWIVLFDDDEYLPLDPYQATEGLVSGAEVEFRVETFWETGLDPVTVAVINTPFVSDDFQIGPDGAYEHGVEESSPWDEIHEEYSRENYPPFGGPFTDALTPWEWLKKNYVVPQRLNS